MITRLYAVNTKFNDLFKEGRVVAGYLDKDLNFVMVVYPELTKDTDIYAFAREENKPNFLIPVNIQIVEEWKIILIQNDIEKSLQGLLTESAFKNSYKKIKKLLKHNGDRLLIVKYDYEKPKIIESIVYQNGVLKDDDKFAKTYYESTIKPCSAFDSCYSKKELRLFYE